MPTPPLHSSAAPIPKKRRSRRNPWLLGLDRLMAVAALANLTLVFFNISYIPLRDLYLRHLPIITRLYDPIKGIEPHRETQQYLVLVGQLEDKLAAGGVQNPGVTTLLTELTDQSTVMINENPFELANKSGTLEKIKNRMRDHMDNPSARDSFRRFWSVDHLRQGPWTRELAYFNKEIQPLIATNYYRPLGESGDFVDFFIILDLPFILLFGCDYLIRTLYLSRRRPGVSWRDTILWRWYDLLFFIPLWRWLRILPVMLRLHQVRWIDLGRMQTQMNRFLAESLAGDMTEIVLVQSVGLAQDAIAQGVFKQWLSSPQPQAVEINEVNEVQELILQALKITIYKVLPQLQPDVERVIFHALCQALNEVPFYQQLQNLPGMTALPQGVAQQVSQGLTQTSQSALTKVLNDHDGQDIFDQLSGHFLEALRLELQDQQTLTEIQTLLTDFLEEMKLTILNRLEDQDTEKLAVEVDQLRQATTQSGQWPAVQVIPGSAPERKF